MPPNRYVTTHWGVYKPRVRDGRVVAMDAAEWDQAPSTIGSSMVDGINAPARVRRPAIRRGFLKHGPPSRDRRGRDDFVEVPWDEALDITARELARVRREFGNSAIFGGSYGWASAGRFHHAQSQVHRFLNCIGGYVRNVDTYSLGAGRALTPHILAPMEIMQQDATAWSNLEKHCQLFVAFGGLPVKNAQVSSGGATEHVMPGAIERMAANGVRFVNISPIHGDLEAGDAVEWLSIKPGTDTALMLALAYVVQSEKLHDESFLSTHATGFERFRAYLDGGIDGVVKNPRWAATITGVDADTIASLARRMAAHRTMINVAWSLQRAIHGEQPFWAATALAAMLGQIGLPGGGIGLGYSCANNIGAGNSAFSGPRVPQGVNAINDYIPVARISDLLLKPGEAYTYNCERRTYPDIRLVYWSGGNPFHHHQDVNRLVQAWRRPEVTVVHEPFWTAHAKFSDIVLPATTSLERDDIGSASGERYMIAMHRTVPPVSEARDDYEIFAGLARRLGVEKAYTEGRSTSAWLRHLYDESRGRATQAGIALPDFDAFWSAGVVVMPKPNIETVIFADFRADPVAHRLPTPSGRIEIFSEHIASFGADDCPGYPVWREPPPEAGLDDPRYPLHLLSGQPSKRLHSQYDHGSESRATKIRDREPLTMHPDDARARGIAAGDVVRVFNDRGALLAGVKLSDRIRPGVVQMATGAWYDPIDPDTDGSLDKHGNPNVVTVDIGTSSFGQGCSAQSARVQIERFEGELPKVTAFEPPRFVADDGVRASSSQARLDRP
jgi:biotin/methionine sulfoxide reductase